MVGCSAVLPIKMGPIDLNTVTARKTIVIKQFLMAAAMFVHKSRHLYVETAIFGDFK